jgi:hypothetical protein
VALCERQHNATPDLRTARCFVHEYHRRSVAEHVEGDLAAGEPGALPETPELGIINVRWSHALSPRLYSD